MKIKMEQIVTGEEEILIKYREFTPEIQRITEFLQKEQLVITGKKEEMRVRLRPGDIYYFESVDEKLFAYTNEAEYQVMFSLAEAEERLRSYGFFRCNKSFVVNMNHIVSVKSEMGSRIDALLDNQEHIIISRRYAKAFRELLRGACEHE